MSAKKRSEVAKENFWNVEAMYPTFSDWEKSFKLTNFGNKNSRWPELAFMRGKLAESPEKIKETLEISLLLSKELSKLYTYAHLRHDEDITNDQYKVAYSQISSLLHHFAQDASWIEPELLSIPDTVLKEYLNAPLLADYRFHLEKIVRIKKHMLSPEKEELLALAGKALQTSHKAFCALNDADFKFEPISDSQGNKHPLSHASYGLYLRSQDRTLRENTFKRLQGKFGEFENTMAEVLNGQVQSHWFEAQARHYPSCLDAALFPKNIDTEVYNALINATDKNMHVLHRYTKLRERLLNIGPLHLYDMHVPLTADIEIKMSYKEAEDIVIESVAPLGADYQNLLQKGLKESGWVDRYENQNKRSGAYSSGCYDSMPYILLNYKDMLRDVFVLAHEAGHSMHSLLSHSHQPYQYGDYPIFLAEVASTFNEELLMRLLLQRFTKKEEQIFLINQKIEDIRSTFFRQTMFAEFELLIHHMAERDTPLTPKLLKEEYSKLNRKYFGPSIIIDPEAEIEWARIPHFYYNFYVFQYATGVSASLALSERVLNGGAAERDEYLSFLKAGSSRYPIDILEGAGVDMRSPKPVESAIRKFDTLVTQLETLTSK